MISQMLTNALPEMTNPVVIQALDQVSAILTILWTRRDQLKRYFIFR